MNAHAYFLGGHDLEMVTIRQLLELQLAKKPGSIDAIHDRGLGWGAKASDYANEIRQAVETGVTCVLIELTVDVDIGSNAIVIDHHNEQAGQDKPTSLEQVLDLNAIGPNDSLVQELGGDRWLRLVSANDRGHVKAMKRLALDPPVTIEEARVVRRRDRMAQGLTGEDERAAEIAIDQHLTTECDGRLTTVQLVHSGTAAICDRLDASLGGPGFQNLLICHPDGVEFFGSGRLVKGLSEVFPNSYYGGSLPEYGFWGHGNRDFYQDIHAFLRTGLE